MRPLRILLLALAAVIVAGTIASASPGVFGDPEDDPSPEATASPEPSVSPEPNATPEPTVSPELTGSPSPSPGVSESSSPSDAAAESEDDPVAPDLSACEGLTGLENAICRHEALLEVHPVNAGLQNALAHLEANQAKHGGDGQETGESSGGEASCPGHSCDEHGNGQGHGKP